MSNGQIFNEGLVETVNYFSLKKCSQKMKKLGGFFTNDTRQLTEPSLRSGLDHMYIFMYIFCMDG